MNNPLEGALGMARVAMMLENLREMLPAQIELMHMKAKLNAEYYKALLEEGIPEQLANYMVSVHDPFAISGSTPEESGGPDD